MRTYMMRDEQVYLASEVNDLLYRATTILQRQRSLCAVYSQETEDLLKEFSLIWNPEQHSAAGAVESPHGPTCPCSSCDAQRAVHTL